jgi:hypothetical protein
MESIVNDSSGILGVIVGAILVLGILFFAFGDKIGLRGGHPSVTVNAPALPTQK